MLQQHSQLSGVGLGLRACHYTAIEALAPNVAWFEVLADNYLVANGPSQHHLATIRSNYAVSLHGVGMSLGSTTPLNDSYLKKLKTLINWLEPQLVSDHLCWTSLAGEYFHELLPLPFTEEAVLHCAQRIAKVQDYLGRQIMIENIANYLSFQHTTLSEWQFLQAVANEADCLILLDINNIYVSAMNTDFKPEDYITNLASERIAQFHLAGFEDYGTHLLDNHSAPVHAAVWSLFLMAVRRFGALPTVIEWDNQIPKLATLQQQAAMAQHYLDNYAVIS